MSMMSEIHIIQHDHVRIFQILRFNEAVSGNLRSQHGQYHTHLIGVQIWIISPSIYIMDV